MQEYKCCPRCGQVKFHTEFGVFKNGSLRTYCKSCDSKQAREWALLHPERVRQKNAEWRRTHKKQARETSAKWRRANPEKYKESVAKWHRDNPEKTRDSIAKWHHNHPERVRENRIGWRRAHPEGVAAANHKRRARKTGNGGSYTAKEWKDLLKYYENRCLCCKRDNAKLTVDHILPVALGGSNNISNIQPLCQPCNSKKHTKHIDYRPEYQEWLAANGGLPLGGNMRSGS